MLYILNWWQLIRFQFEICMHCDDDCRILSTAMMIEMEKVISTFTVLLSQKCIHFKYSWLTINKVSCEYTLIYIWNSFGSFISRSKVWTHKCIMNGICNRIRCSVLLHFISSTGDVYSIIEPFFVYHRTLKYHTTLRYNTCVQCGVLLKCRYRQVKKDGRWCWDEIELASEKDENHLKPWRWMERTAIKWKMGSFSFTKLPTQIFASQLVSHKKKVYTPFFSSLFATKNTPM